MKKFISWVSLIAVIVSVMSCREAEELITTPDELRNQPIPANVKKDSIGINPNTTNESNPLEGQESDPPPKKDEINW